MNIKTYNTTHRQRGTAAVELAIALPFLLFLMLAIAEVGRAIVQYNELTQSTHDAARYLANHAIVGSTDIIDIDLALEKATRHIVAFGSIRASQTPILPGLSMDDVSVTTLDELHVRVDVVYDYVPMLGSIAMPMFGTGPTFDLAVPLRASVVMRAL